MRRIVMKVKTPAQMRRERQNRLGKLYIVLSTVVLVFVIVVYIALKQKQVRVNPQTMCPCDGEPSAYYALLIDITDRYSETERAFIMRYLEGVKAEVPLYGRVSVYVISDEIKQVLDPIIALCNPGTGEGVSRVTGNPDLLMHKWTTSFSEPLDSLLSTVMEFEESSASPIMETIQSISISGFSHIGTNQSGNPKKLIIVSDMLQHTTGHSQYNSPEYDFSAFGHSSYYERVRSHLPGVDVSILYLRNDEYANLQGISHVRFWEDYVRSLGALLTTVERVPG